MTQTVALVLIATTLAALVFLTWATIHYVPLVLYGDDETDGGRPS